MDSRNLLLEKIRRLKQEQADRESVIRDQQETMFSLQDDLKAANGRVEGYKLELTHNSTQLEVLRRQIDTLNDTIALLHKTAIRV
jgi:septal ring factor EnvC (AmiA/AmiB activator)